MAEVKKKGRWLTGIIARVLMLAAAALLFLSYASMVVNPSKAWYMTALGLLFVPIALLNLFLLIWAARRKSGAFWIPLLALLPSLIFIGRYYQFSSGGEQRDDKTIKVVSYNVGRFAMGRKTEFKEPGGKQACMDSVTRLIKNLDADIVCLQEFDLSGEYDVAGFLRDHFPEYEAGYFMHINSGGAYGNITLSRFPIADKGHFQFEKSSNQAIYTDLKINPGTTVRVYNCHFQSYNISISNLIKDGGRDSTLVRETEEKMKKSITRRPQQVEQVIADIEGCTLESFVVGDFNDNPMSYTYHRLMKGRKDTFVEAGKGFGATHTSLWPLIRIDYILYPNHFKAVSNRIPKLKYSDHYPVIAEISF